MSVEQLMERLKTLPAHYEVLAYCDGVEIRDTERGVVHVSLDAFTKHVLLELTPNTPPIFIA